MAIGIELTEGYEHGKDAEVKVSLEALPDVPTPDIDNIKLDRLTVEADEKAVDEQIKQLASQSKRWEDAPKKISNPWHFSSRTSCSCHSRVA